MSKQVLVNCGSAAEQN